MVLNDVTVLACPEKGRKCESGGVVIQSDSVRRIMRTSRRVIFVLFVLSWSRLPSERDLAPQPLVVPGPSNHSSHYQSRDR